VTATVAGGKLTIADRFHATQISFSQTAAGSCPHWASILSLPQGRRHDRGQLTVDRKPIVGRGCAKRRRGRQPGRSAISSGFNSTRIAETANPCSRATSRWSTRSPRTPPPHNKTQQSAQAVQDTLQNQQSSLSGVSMDEKPSISCSSSVPFRRRLSDHDRQQYDADTIQMAAY